MLRRIRPEQVRLGMFIEGIDGHWEDQRFWRSRFLLERVNDLESLKRSGVAGIIINTTEGTETIAPVRKEKKRALPKAQIARALQTIQESKPLIKTMFEDARMGQSVPVGTAMEVVEQIAKCAEDSSLALIQVSRLKARDEYTFLHSIAVTALMVHFGRTLQMTEENVQTLAMGGLLHDIGKVKVPLKILNKSGRLTAEEMAVVRNHPQHSYELLSRQGDVPDAVLDICLHHHERLDGKGYPKGLAGDQIGVSVRMAAICDVYDALTSKRAYKKAWAPRDAESFMLDQIGQFDQALLRQFFSSLRLLSATH
ncbi:HD-GYP domain-containing protein [Agrobacterium tumefaciens]|uniref:HD-GYP domain-containing protein n=1 Tax=Agrobacterium tumefaciens TaxID=358 RepID=UPI0009757628|nr:hypothetical protein BV900_27410 [Agrobacterium tumefaciens]